MKCLRFTALCLGRRWRDRTRGHRDREGRRKGQVAHLQGHTRASASQSSRRSLAKFLHDGKAQAWALPIPPGSMGKAIVETEVCG
jgi:hypothetical protein